MTIKEKSQARLTDAGGPIQFRNSTIIFMQNERRSFLVCPEAANKLNSGEFKKF